MRKILIDTDGNLEALEAIKAVLKDKNVSVEAITTVASGLSVEEATSNVLTMLKEVDAEKVNVYKGLSQPIINDHGSLKLSTHSILGSELKHTDIAEDAINAILNLAKDGDLEIITMGPLSNIAQAFARDGKTMSKVKKITMLAGMIFHGDVGPMSEYNFYTDAYAADFVFKQDVDITLIPIEVGTYTERMRYALKPELIHKQYDSYTRIDLDGQYTYGANINDVRDRSREEFVAQSNVMHPFNCTLVADNSTEEITMEA